ncbi:MAG: potassium channel family protein, partial [Panacibacter sp.]
MKKPFHLLYWFGIILIIMLSGTVGFMLIEHYALLDAFYMTLITVTTIGYTEVRPLSSDGKIFNIILIIASFTTFTYALAKLTQFLASGEMAFYFKTRKLMQAIDKLSNHVIICGFGRNGQQAALTLKVHKVNFVVIENSMINIDQWLTDDPSLIYVHGDATEDDTLLKAGIKKARAMIIALPTDADNVFIVLSARSLNPHIQIISRASHQSSLQKLKKAGADNIIMPDRIGGTHMATLVSKPDVVEFIDYLSGEEGESISMESVSYEKLPPHLRDQTLKVVMDWKKTGVNCIGVKNVDGKFLINPPDDTIISKG